LRECLAQLCRQRLRPDRELREGTLPVLIPAAESPACLHRGEIDHAIVVAAQHWWQLDGQR